MTAMIIHLFIDTITLTLTLGWWHQKLKLDFSLILDLQITDSMVEGPSNPSNRPFSLGGHVKSQENKKLCFCMASLAHTRIQCEASGAKQSFLFS